MSNDEYLKDRVRIISPTVLSAYGRFGRFRNNGELLVRTRPLKTELGRAFESAGEEIDAFFEAHPKKIPELRDPHLGEGDAVRLNVKEFLCRLFSLSMKAMSTVSPDSRAFARMLLPANDLLLKQVWCTENAFVLKRSGHRSKRDSDDPRNAAFTVRQWIDELKACHVPIYTRTPFDTDELVEMYRALPDPVGDMFFNYGIDGTAPEGPCTLIRDFVLMLENKDETTGETVWARLSDAYAKRDKKTFNNVATTFVKNFVKFQKRENFMLLGEGEICEECPHCTGYGNCTRDGGKPPKLMHKEMSLLQLCRPAEWIAKRFG